MAARFVEDLAATVDAVPEEQRTETTQAAVFKGVPAPKALLSGRYQDLDALDPSHLKEQCDIIAETSCIAEPKTSGLIRPTAAARESLPRPFLLNIWNQPRGRPNSWNNRS